jgi:tetratricopeptide (TPR) repeat protein
MAELEIERNQWGLALEYTRNARDKLRTIQNVEGEADTWFTEARALLHMGYSEKSLDASNYVFELFTTNKNLHRAINAYRHISKVLMKIGKQEEAGIVLHKAVDIANQLHLGHEQAMLYLHLSEIELQNQNYEIAKQHGIRARSISERDGLDDIINEVDKLFCFNLMNRINL